jgi:RNA polymerase sigma factor (sigma-70 family)
MSAIRTLPQERRQRVHTLACELYAAHHRRLLAISTRNSPSVEDAEEALHDAFTLFIDHFDPDGQAPPVAWLTLTLKRRCWATYRHQRLLPMQPLSPTLTPLQPSPETAAQRPLHELAEITHDAKRMRGAFKQLKPNERRALSMLALGYSYTEIAERTGWTYTKVNRCITEGRARLRRLIPAG